MAHRCAVIAVLFDAGRGTARARNLAPFLEGLSSAGIAPALVEVAIGDAPYLLDRDTAFLRLRVAERLWHKERCIALAVDRLPDAVDGVAWLDADVIFERHDWLGLVAETLDDVAVLQPMSEVVRLPPGTRGPMPGAGPALATFAAMQAGGPVDLGGGMAAHGHTGFAWAARRAVFESCGLFEVCLAGCGDHMMAHGFLGDTGSACIARHTAGAPAYRAAFADWAGRARAATGGRVAAVPGRVWHLDHGSAGGASYLRRTYDLLQVGFDPGRDLMRDPAGLLVPKPGAAGLRSWLSDHHPAPPSPKGGRA